MVYANVEAHRITVDDRIYSKAPGIHIHLPAKEMIQMASQYTRNTLVLVDTTRKDGNILSYFNLFLEKGEPVPGGHVIEKDRSGNEERDS